MDEELMGPLGWTSPQLMELAGLSCAMGIRHVYAPDLNRRVLVVCGPGNNGGDGLICARHLSEYGYKVEIYYPKQPPALKHLQVQAETYQLPFLPALPAAAELNARYELIVDAIFGYSFKGDLRAPFDSVLKALNASDRPVVSLDIPSGWDVMKGNVTGLGVNPSLLISLAVPKMCANFLPSGCRHLLGGRFIPPSVNKKWDLRLPVFPADAQVVDIGPRPVSPSKEAGVMAAAIMIGGGNRL
jgi:NAD(P)H-hydrate epimerase